MNTFPKDKNGFDDVLGLLWTAWQKRPISVPCLKNIDVRGTACLFLTHVPTLYRHKGAPLIIVSDRGSQFISDFWTNSVAWLGRNWSFQPLHTRRRMARPRLLTDTGSLDWVQSIDSRGSYPHSTNKGRAVESCGKQAAASPSQD